MCDTEVEDLRLTALVDRNVRGLEIAVNDAAQMRMMHRIADLGHQFQPLAGGEVMRLDVAVQPLALDQLHRKERLESKCRGGRAGVVHLRDAWMLQTAEQGDLPMEAPHQIGPGEVRLDDFEGDSAARV